MQESQGQFKKIYRSREDRVLGGVCAGIAEYFGTDPLLVRIIFVFLTLIGAAGFLLYIVLWIMIPEKNSNHHSEFVHEVKQNIHRSHRAAHGMIGLFIILVGLLLLIDRFYPGLGFSKFWPLFIIAFGVLILLKHHDRDDHDHQHHNHPHN